jgi:hypothetical protein
MATGNYGVIRPADVSPSEIQIYYNFAPNRNVVPTTYFELDATSVITRSTLPTNPLSVNSFFPGIYNLNLPANQFSQKGIYNIVIRPREYVIRIVDCGVLSSAPDIKGIVLNVNELPTQFAAANELIGYRVEYFNPDLSKKVNYFKIITSSGRVEAVNQNVNNTSQKAIRYRYRDDADLVFCTLTPTSAPLTTPNKVPFFGTPGGLISLTNTHFNPIHIELEMAEHDIDTLSYGIYGNQTKSIQDGVYTIYNNQNQIYRQYSLYEVQDDAGNPLYEVREQLQDIDNTKEFQTLTNI